MASITLINEMNKIATSNSWLLLLDVVIDISTTLYIVNNTENITFQGNVYQKFPFQIEDTKQTAKGEMPSIQLRVGNVTRFLQTYIEQYSGGVGWQVTIYVVNSAYLSEDYSEFQMSFDVLATSADAQWIIFTLGAPNPLRHRFPQDRYISRYCRFIFKSIKCGHTGTEYTTCGRHLDDCRIRNNSVRFGGFMGLSNRTVRLI